MTHDDSVRKRFAATADGVTAHSREQVDRLREELRSFLAPLSGDERALDSGTGAGTLAIALAPLVGEVVGTISMDSFAVLLPGELPAGTPVTLIGDGVSAESHATVAGTINYEIVTGIESNPGRASREVVDA